MPVDHISRISPFGPKSEYVNVIIEAPKGSRTKFKYDPKHGLFVYDKAMPIGQTFPFDFGFLLVVASRHVGQFVNARWIERQERW